MATQVEVVETRNGGATPVTFFIVRVVRSSVMRSISGDVMEGRGGLLASSPVRGDAVTTA